MIREEVDRERVFAIMNTAWHGLYLDDYTAADITDVSCVKYTRPCPRGCHQNQQEFNRTRCQHAAPDDQYFMWHVYLDGRPVAVVTDDPGERVILHRNTGFPEVPDSYEDYAIHGLRPPHCDPRVLHAPGECEVCDKHARNVQRYRTLVNTSFTGKTDNRWPCPADVARPGTNQIWQGNQPWRSE